MGRPFRWALRRLHEYPAFSYARSSWCAPRMAIPLRSSQTSNHDRSRCPRPQKRPGTSDPVCQRPSGEGPGRKPTWAPRGRPPLSRSARPVRCDQLRQAVVGARAIILGRAGHARRAFVAQLHIRSDRQSSDTTRNPAIPRPGSAVALHQSSSYVPGVRWRPAKFFLPQLIAFTAWAVKRMDPVP